MEQNPRAQGGQSARTEVAPMKSMSMMIIILFRDPVILIMAEATNNARCSSLGSEWTACCARKRSRVKTIFNTKKRVPQRSTHSCSPSQLSLVFAYFRVTHFFVKRHKSYYAHFRFDHRLQVRDCGRVEYSPCCLLWERNARWRPVKRFTHFCSIVVLNGCLANRLGVFDYCRLEKISRVTRLLLSSLVMRGVVLFVLIVHGP